MKQFTDMFIEVSIIESFHSYFISKAYFLGVAIIYMTLFHLSVFCPILGTISSNHISCDCQAGVNLFKHRTFFERV